MATECVFDFDLLSCGSDSCEKIFLRSDLDRIRGGDLPDMVWCEQSGIEACPEREHKEILDFSFYISSLDFGMTSDVCELGAARGSRQ